MISSDPVAEVFSEAPARHVEYEDGKQKKPWTSALGRLIETRMEPSTILAPVPMRLKQPRKSFGVLKLHGNADSLSPEKIMLRGSTYNPKFQPASLRQPGIV